MPRTTLRPFPLLLLLSLVLPAGPAAAQGVPIRLGVTPNLTDAPPLLALELGYFREAGLDVKPSEFGQGTEVRNALAAAAIDLGSMADVPFLIGAAKSPLRGIALTSWGGERQKIMVASRSSIRGIADLKGKRVASQAGSSLDATFREVLRQHGVDPSEVQIFNLRLPDMPSALASGSVDAMVDIEPFNALAEERGTARKLADFGRDSLAPYVLVARQEFIERFPDGVVAYLRALLRAQTALRERPDEAAETLGRILARKGSDLPASVIRKNMLEAHYTADLDPPMMGFLAKVMAQLRREGKVGETDAGRLLDLRWLSRARGGKE
jgi:NitT/TauT family transport system substrate-binding protein